MASFYIYEWRDQWVGQPTWLKASGACSVAKGSTADWFAVYSSNPVQLIGQTVLSKPQAWGALCAGVVMPQGMVTPGWTGLSEAAPPPRPPPGPPPPVPPPPPPPPPPEIAILVGLGVAVAAGVATYYVIDRLS